MGDKVGRVALFGIPLQQTWYYPNSGNFAPRYYTESDAPLYYYSFTDAYIAHAYKSLPSEQQARFDPMITDAIHCQHVLAIMATAGMYETSGDWLYDLGMPDKSGVGRGIVCISPGKGGLGTLAPPLDAADTNVKGQFVARHLAEQLGLNIFASAPASPR
jgi:hypothetical protein